MIKKNHLKPAILAVVISSLVGCNTAVLKEKSQLNNANNLSLNEVGSNISLAQVTEDVTHLASDKLKGRGNFSDEINLAADYIAARFKQAGLVPLKGSSSYLQPYVISRITPNKLAVTINQQPITANKLAIATTRAEINWQNSDQVTLHHINQDDDMRAMLSKMNAAGGQHLVLVSSSQQAIFSRYQHYFNQGLTKLGELNHENTSKVGGSIVMVLTDIKQPTQFNISAKTTMTQVSLNNVVAVLPGKSKANEMVLFSAHYDHLGSKTDDSSQIYNGADDDASGTSAVINLASHFAKQDTHERSLVFSAFSAEEIGGFGSRYFSQQLAPDAIVAMINIEMIGKPSKFGKGTVWMTGMDRSNLGEQLNSALLGTDLQIHSDPYPEQNLFYRSDNATLARLGVPAHSFSSTQLDKDKHYHQTSDDIHSLDLPSMHEVIKTLAIATQPLVTGKVTPSRIDTTKVKSKGLIF